MEFIPSPRDEKANQCLCRGCDCGYRTDKLHHKAGDALNGNRNEDDVNVNQNNANNHNGNGAFRGALRVYELWTDFSHQPSILPISASFAWSWKILVSLTSANSKIMRSFNVAISNWLLALIKYPAFKDFGAFLAMMR